MRRSTLAVLTTVSLAALVSVATTSQAVQSPAVILGVLKPAEDWKVGTVNVTGASFCAMVNKYDSGVGLAFARSPEGYGTIAMDLRQNVFTPNNMYEVQLKAEHGAPRKLEGRATSARSLVIQIGQDKSLYDALNGNGNMEISMPVADVTFSLAKFSNSFKSLLTCADKLAAKSASASTGGAPKMAAVKVQEVEQASLAPIDKEVQKLNGGAKTQTAANTAPNSLDAQLDAAANAEVQASKSNIAKLDQQHQDITDQINAGRQQAARIEGQKQQVERKLLASAHTETPPVPPANTGATAKLWDDEQTTAAAKRAEEQAKQAALQQAVDAKNEQIARAEAAKAEAARQQVAQSAAQQKALEQKAAELQKQSAAIEAKQAVSDSKALKASLVAKEAQLAGIDAQHAAERDQLTQKLAATQSDFQTKIAALTTERDGFKVQLDAALAETAHWRQADASDRAQAQALQARLAQSDDVRHGLETRIAQMEAQAKTLATAAPAFPADNKELAALKAELADLKTQDAAKVAALEEKLTDKSAQFDAMKGQYDTLQKQGRPQVAAADPNLAKEHQVLADQLSQKQAEIDRLQKKLAQIESDRATEAGHVQQAQADLGMRKSLVFINDDELPGRAKGATGVASAVKNADLEKAQAELASLREKNAALSEQLALAATKPSATPASPENAKAQAELADLRAKNAALSQQLAATVQPAAGPNPALEKAQAELADLRAKNAELSSKLAASAAPAAVVKTADDGKAQAELAELRAKNAALSQRLATIVSSEPKPLPSSLDAQTHAQQRSRLASVQADAVSQRSEKADVDEEAAASHATAAPVTAVAEDAIAPPARALAQLQPSSGETAAAPLPASSLPPPAPVRDRSTWWTSANAGYSKAPVPVPAAQPSAAPDPVDADIASAPQPDPSFDENRAAAFLDRIMAYHRPAGSDLPPAPSAVASADVAPVFGEQNLAATQAEASVPALLPRRKPQSAIAAAPAPAPYQPALARLEPAAGATVPHDSGMTSMPDEDDIAAAPAPVSVPVRMASNVLPRTIAAPAVSGGRPVTLENLLMTSGVDAKFKHGADNNIRQWVSGTVNGMYEQLPPGDFTTQAQNYIGRYRQDCPGGLNVNMGEPQTTEAGTFAEANISCNMASNSYSTSFVFVQDSRKFSAILHTGYPGDASKVRNIGDNIAYALGSSGGLLPPSAVQSADASPAPAPVQRRFNIRDDVEQQPAATTDQTSFDARATGEAGFGARADDNYNDNGNEPETVVVQ